MSQREDLLRGAQECIAEKGYARTTARDIAAASGANLASIGYYFGSKDALLNAAVVASFEEWGTSVEQAMEGVEDDAPLGRLRRFLDSYLASLPSRRNTLVSSLQAMAEAEYAPEVRQQIAASHEEGHRSLAAMVLGIEPEQVTEADLALGAVVLSLLNGVALQWYISADSVPSGEELTAAVVALASR